MSEGNPKIKAYRLRKMTGFCTAVFCGCAEEKALFRSKTNNRRLISIDSAVIQFWLSVMILPTVRKPSGNDGLCGS